MKKSTKIPLAGLSLLALGFSSTHALADDSRGFRSSTRLSSAQEVPANDSQGAALAVITFSRDFSSARVRVRFSGLEGDFTRLHLHCNVAGANGPVALGLIDMIAPPLDNSDNVFLNGNVIQGRISNLDFPAEDPCLEVIGRPVNNLVSLAAAIDAGYVYWNLHTTTVPPGEIRGQARPSNRTGKSD